MAWPTFTVDVTQNNNQIKVYGAVPASEIPAGFEVIISGISNLEVSYGTAVMYDGSNNPYSHLYLVRPYSGATATSIEMVVKPTGSQFNDVVSIFQNASNLLNSTMAGFRQFVEGTTPVSFQPLDENAEPISIKPLLQMNQEAQTAVSEAISAFQNAAGTAAGYDVTESPQDIEVGKLVKVEERYFTTNFSVTLPENVTRRYMDVELPSVSRSLLIKVSAVAKQGQQLGMGGFDAVYVVERSSTLSVNTLHSSEFTGSYRIGLAEPIIDGNVVHFGLRRGNNGTSTNANVHFKVEVLCESRSDFNLTYSDGSVSHAYTNHSNKVLHTGNTGQTVGYDVTSNHTDTGNGANGQPKLLRRGDFGIGGSISVNDFNNPATSGIGYTSDSALNSPTGVGGLLLTNKLEGNQNNSNQSLSSQFFLDRNGRRCFFRHQNANASQILNAPWKELLHNENTGSIVTEDYEEGTWTPASTIGGSSVPTLGFQCKYRKIGEMYFIVGQVDITRTTETGPLVITGLPVVVDKDTIIDGIRWVTPPENFQFGAIINASGQIYFQGKMGLIAVDGSDLSSTQFSNFTFNLAIPI